MKQLDVSEATHLYDTVFVSSIRTYGNLGPFRPANRADFKGIRLFDMLLRPSQVVCGSTVREGDSDGTLYGNWGIIIGSGDIQQAFPYDATSYVKEGHAVSPYGWRNDGIDITTQVARAIEYRSGHNEVDIALGECSIAGLFFGEQELGVDGIDMPSESVLKMIEPLQLPAYRLTGGRFHRIHEDHTDTSATSPAAIIDHHTSTPETVADYMKTELARRLLLPPRNAVSAGWQAGTMERRHPGSDFTATVERFLDSDAIDQRYFGSMAVFAAELTSLYDLAAFDKLTYDQLTQRILPEGMLQASRVDIDYYLGTGRAPEYLGKI